MATWHPTLMTKAPERGYEQAVKLSRVAIKMTQPDAAIREKLRPEYAESFDGLIASNQVVAIHFATVAAANGYWRCPSSDALVTFAVWAKAVSGSSVWSF